MKTLATFLLISLMAQTAWSDRADRSFKAADQTLAFADALNQYRTGSVPTDVAESQLREAGSKLGLWDAKRLSDEELRSRARQIKLASECESSHVRLIVQDRDGVTHSTVLSEKEVGPHKFVASMCGARVIHQIPVPAAEPNQ